MPSLTSTLGKQIERIASEVSALVGGGPQIVWLDDIDGESKKDRTAREEAEFVSRWGRGRQPQDIVIRWGSYEEGAEL